MRREIYMNFDGTIRILGAPAPVTNSPIVCLVHGYNNDFAQAKESYLAMRRNLDNALRFCEVEETLRKDLQRDIWEFYWPGYHPLTLEGPLGLQRHDVESAISAPSYSLEVIKARSWVPDGLSEFLRRVNPSNLFFIGHSLGARVVFETIARILPEFQNRVSGFLIMAGAVPAHLLTKSDLSALRQKRRALPQSGETLTLRTSTA